MTKNAAMDVLMDLRHSLTHGSKYMDRYGKDRTHDVVIAIGMLNDVLTETDKHNTPDRIIRSGRATIIYWTDGSKTIVKRSEEQADDPYYAFCAAVAKRVYETNSRIKRILEKKTVEQKESEKDKKPRKSTPKAKKA